MTQEHENFLNILHWLLIILKKNLLTCWNFFLQQKRITLQQFIQQHQHEIYHLCFNKYPCCHCSSKTRPNSIKLIKFWPLKQLRKCILLINRLLSNNHLLINRVLANYHLLIKSLLKK